MDKYDFDRVSKHTATLGNSTISISNHPYSSFCLWKYQDKTRDLPSRYTVYKAYQKLQKDIYE